MANVKLIFKGTESLDDSYQPELQCYVNKDNEIFIEISNSLDEQDFSFICLDKSTAIRFAKTIRTEINKIAD